LLSRKQEGSAMTKKACVAVVAFGVLAVGAGRTAFAADEKGVAAKAAFARLEALAGEWKVEAHDTGHASDQPMKIVYRVTANGSAVMETLFPGTDHEMVTMYHLDGDDLRLTHYCAMKNQPHLKLDKAASTADALVFAFDGGTNLDPEKDMHMHSGRIFFREGGRVESEWDGYKGREKLHTAKFALSRP
jgi:hypothetical protein